MRGMRKGSYQVEVFRGWRTNVHSGYFGVHVKDHLAVECRVMHGGYYHR